MSTPIPTPIYPENDFAWIATLKDVNLVTGKVGPLVSGTVTAFLATSNGPTAVAADVNLVATCTKISDGKWLVFFDATVLTTARLVAAFGAAPAACYLIVVQAGGMRTVADLVYTPNRQATIV